jgi:branched-subunit amino acid aminotransferase/4-amino-4-deoxychorismate lyase
MSAAWIWHSGRFAREAEAVVPATSRSVRSGFGVFETLRVRGGRGLLLPRHLARLEASATSLGLWRGPLDAAGILAELSRRNQLDDAFARITLGDGFAHVALSPLPTELDEQRGRGLRLPVIALARALPGVKSTSRLELEIAERDAGGEALLSRSRVELLETTRANFFAVTDRGLETAAPTEVLPGIGRQLVLEIATERKLAVCTAAPRLTERERWREAFAISSARGVRPVREIDATPLAASTGPITLELQRAFDERAGRSD